MDGKIDKRDRAAAFRARLGQAMTVAGLNRSALSRAAGADRSTIAQLLASDRPRMPNAHLAANCAAALGVSADWLLGLTERPERPGDIVADAVSVTKAERSLSDDRILDWHREAAGYKIRHIPATAPDLFKTEAVLRWEYRDFLGKTPNQAITAMRDRIALLREGGSDYEIAAPLHEIESLARGEGYYRGLDAAARGEQIDHMIAVCEEFYPSLRLFLFDARRVFSAPVTIFGPLVGVVYVGRFHLAFRESSRIRSLTEHFDWLVREADVDARGVAGWMRDLRNRAAGR